METKSEFPEVDLEATKKAIMTKRGTPRVVYQKGRRIGGWGREDPYWGWGDEDLIAWEEAEGLEWVH